MDCLQSFFLMYTKTGQKLNLKDDAKTQSISDSHTSSSTFLSNMYGSNKLP
jgi:hypothetical protein